MDSVNQQLLVSSGKVGPPDASLEQHVSSKHDWRIPRGVDENHMSRTVTGNLADFQRDSSDDEAFLMSERLRGGR